MKRCKKYLFVRRIFVASDLERDLKVVRVKVVPVLHTSIYLVPEKMNFIAQ